MRKYLVIHMVKNSQGIAYNKVCGVFDLPQEAEAYKDKYDRRMLDSYMVTATLDLDEKGRYVPQDFEYNEDEPCDEKTILGAMGAFHNISENVSLDEAFANYPVKHEEALNGLVGENKVVSNPEDLGDKNPFRDDPNGIKDEMKELK